MEAIGPLLLVFSIPLMLRWVPPHRFFGLRVPATCSNRTLWYDVNAVTGRHLFVLGLPMVALEFVIPRSMRIYTLATVGWVGFFGIFIADWRKANQMRRDRKGRTP